METAKLPISWARIGMYGGIGGVVGGIAGALISKDNKVMSGLIGFAVIGLIGAFIGFQTSKNTTMITINPK